MALIGDINLCGDCRKMHGKIFPIRELVRPFHQFCRCVVTPMQAVASGYATQDGTAGADYWLKYYNKLPECYTTKTDARKQEWISKKGNLAEVLPGKMIGGDRYYNDDGRLPVQSGRIWFEADIDYTSGYRGFRRILYSNDGLIFATYDHYNTFVEVV